jgi:pimeloyl-ACP methyl ester carboxylesterase
MSADLAPGEHCVRVGDIDMFFRVLGGGAPLLLLHGGFESADYWQTQPYGLLGERFTAIAIDSRGQGRTTGTDAPITYAQMALDTVRLLDRLGLAAVHVLGHSDGGCIALHLLMSFAHRIKSATLIGTPFNTSNYPPAVMAQLRNLVSAARAGTALKGRAAAYRAVAPSPEYWWTLTKKLGDTWLSEPRFTIDELRSIRRRVLVIDADADPFLPSSVFRTLAGAIPKATLRSFAGGTHNVARESPEELVAAMCDLVRLEASDAKSSETGE